MTSINNIKEGDLVKIKGLNSKDEVVYWYGQLVDDIQKDLISVLLLDSQPNGTLTWGEHQHSFDINTVDDFEIVKDKTSSRCFRKAWKQLGIRVINLKK